ncbi:MAG: DUF1847 domain-containing protein [Deltaproteobacteria bacterium]|nr:DUF1847 domain-containing protein [Deltaproteobacteria bacterium]
MKKDTKESHPSCASCNLEIRARACLTEKGKGFKGCPTLTRHQIITEANKAYEDPEIRDFARNASIQEAECYANRGQRPYILQPTKTRIMEICEFSEKMGYQRLGLAFCVGLIKEAKIVEDILKCHGFEVVSVLCKAGRTPKESIGLTDEQKVYQGTDEAMCNPISQAKLLNHEHTQFNILLGLCVGHDSLFFKYAAAPTTVLAVKDRVTGHNPLAAVYLSQSYYRKVKHPEVVSS